MSGFKLILCPDKTRCTAKANCWFFNFKIYKTEIEVFHIYNCDKVNINRYGQSRLQTVAIGENFHEVYHHAWHSMDIKESSLELN